MMWWSVWCFAMVACGVCAEAAPAASGMSPVDWREVDEDVYAVPVGGRIGAAPWMYYAAEEPHDSQTLMEQRGARARPKRKMPSLSISNPMEVLRQRLLLEVARKQMREASQRQAVANRVFLQNVGKRGFWADTVPSHYDD